MTTLLLTLSVFLLYLLWERISLTRLRNRIALVIAVTGTRGKTSVVRALASVLRESGRIVVAKTTGSQAQIVLPDGSVKHVPRRGVVSILEQTKVLRKAVALHADCLVVEIMSIHPENHEVESHRILKPDTVVLTNVRRDHTEAMGETEEEIGRVLSLGIPPGAKVYVPEEFRNHILTAVTRRSDFEIISVRKGTSDRLVDRHPEFQKKEFAENLDLTTAVARDLGADDETIARGALKAVHDIGRFRVWTYRAGGKRIFLVNAFAANDPESTRMVIEKTRETLATQAFPLTGLLNLRSDRGDRTAQWIEALRDAMASDFKRIYVIGGHANIVRRKLKAVEVIRHTRPEEITNSIASAMGVDEVLFGFGNIGGAGQRLVEHWQRMGEEYGI